MVDIYLIKLYQRRLKGAVMIISSSKLKIGREKYLSPEPFSLVQYFKLSELIQQYTSNYNGFICHDQSRRVVVVCDPDVHGLSLRVER